MTEESTSHDPEASIWRTVTLDDDPFDRRLNDVCGLDEERDKLRRTFLAGLTDPTVAVRAPCLLIYGPAGRGKRRFAQAVTGELAAHSFSCVHVTPATLPDRDAHRQGRTEPELGYVIKQLARHEPAVLLLEGLHDIRVTRDGELSTAIEELRRANERVAVICVLSQDQGRISPQNAPEYFAFADITIELDEVGRERQAALLEVTLDELTAGTAVTVCADTTDALHRSSEAVPVDAIQDVCRRAMLLAHSNADRDGTVETSDVTNAIEQVAAEEPSTERPGAPRRSKTSELFQPDVPTVSFDDIGGLDTVIRRLQELATYPEQYADLYAELTVSPSTGVLLAGPPGTGKTLLAKALATETERTWYSVEGPSVKNKWFGESEARIRRLFDTARNNAPSLIFFDEFDAIAPSRTATGSSPTQSIVNTLLAELDGVAGNDGLFVVAATNRPDVIDPALTRSGRLSETIPVPVPDTEGLREIFRIHTAGLSMSGVDAAWFSTQVPDGTTGADVAAIVERALHVAIRRRGGDGERPAINRGDMQTAIEMIEDQESRSSRGFQ